MRLRAGVVSDCGMVRSANEDSFLLRPGLYAVCDGMGGARAGEVASQMACLGLLSVDPPSAGTQGLREAILKANTAIIQRSTSESELLGMGTTLTAALLADDTLLIAHVGDSRAYLLHEGVLAQVTEDHSWVGEMIRRGDLTREQAARHPHRSVITKALGTDMVLDPDMLELTVTPGDRVLICSDGLTGMVGDETIARIMERGDDAQTTAQELVDAALQNGGEDNVTVIVVDVEASEQADAGKEGSWSDSRILIGPSDRRSTVVAAPSGMERLSLNARERLRRRGVALRAGAVSSDHPEGETEDREESETAEVGKDESSPATVPPPKGEGGKSKGDRGNAHKRRRRWLVAAVTLLLVLVIAIGSLAWYNSTVYYLGQDNGKVALYQGLPWDFVGVEFSSVYRLSAVEYGALSLYERGQVDSRELLSKEEGERFLDGLSTGF